MAGAVTAVPGPHSALSGAWKALVSGRPGNVLAPGAGARSGCLLRRVLGASPWEPPGLRSPLSSCKVYREFLNLLCLGFLISEMGTPLLVFVTGLVPQGTLCHSCARDARGEREGVGSRLRGQQRQPGLRRRGLQTEPFSSLDEGCPSLPPPVSETPSALQLRASLVGDSGESLGLPHSPLLRTSVSS